MVRYICQIALLFSVLATWGSAGHAQPDSVQASTLAEKVQKLKDYHEKSFGHADSLHYRRKFFEAFPNSFAELDSLYGYDDGNPGPLYDQGVDHIIRLFNRLECVNDTAYYKKLINTSIGGRWDADAINYFQRGLHERALSKPRLFFDLLSEYPDSKIRGFSYFFYHGGITPPPFDGIPYNFRALKEEFPRVYSQMKLAFKKAVADSGHR